ncbi:hypothetical protein [Carnobacterium maltaromaticum]|uniref:hypothetical protein n=1 Tax=Carnobacterium maltaromaticum TaxID=2751 RepID=UPI0039B0BB28
MTEYYTAHDVLEKVEGLHSLSTLNKWANFIQKECEYLFHYDYIPFINHTWSNKTINHRKTRLFSTVDIQKFQKVAKLIPMLGREKALRQIFDTKHFLNTMNHNELINEIMIQVEGKLIAKENTFHTLEKTCQQLERQYYVLGQRLTKLEELLSAQEQTSSGWFRRKR